MNSTGTEDVTEIMYLLLGKLTFLEFNHPLILGQQLKDLMQMLQMVLVGMAVD